MSLRRDGRSLLDGVVSLLVDWRWIVNFRRCSPCLLKVKSLLFSYFGRAHPMNFGFGVRAIKLVLARLRARFYEIFWQEFLLRFSRLFYSNLEPPAAAWHRCVRGRVAGGAALYYQFRLNHPIQYSHVALGFCILHYHAFSCCIMLACHATRSSAYL